MGRVIRTAAISEPAEPFSGAARDLVNDSRIRGGYLGAAAV
jgi:hypothetical protein